MAEQLLEQVRDVVDGQIDFEGQKLAELIANVALSVSGVCIPPSHLDVVLTSCD
jgi:signal peptidase complex subunit 1